MALAVVLERLMGLRADTSTMILRLAVGDTTGASIPTSSSPIFLP
jgi:hypothetical protein